MDTHSVFGLRAETQVTSGSRWMTSLLCAALASLASGCGNSGDEKPAAGPAQVDEWQTLLTGD